jgi:hypothetical protein
MVPTVFDRWNSGASFVQRKVSAEPIVVIGIGLQHAAQVCLAEHYDVVETFAPNRAVRTGKPSPA